MTGLEGSQQSENQECGFICISTTIDELSYSPSAEEKARNATHVIETGRRSWKTLRGKGEAVWPATLEAALLEALEKYNHGFVGTKGGKRVTNRLPMRNRFISDYIFATTGKRRTSKQVGSRLQQLRSTCTEDRILKLLQPQMIRTEGTNSQESIQPRSPSPASDHLLPASVSPDNLPQLECDVVYVHISLQNNRSQSNAMVTSSKLDNNNIQRTLQIVGPSLLPYQNPTDGYVLPAVPIHVQLMSPVSLLGESRFFVYGTDDINYPIHTELALLEVISSPHEGSGWVYRSTLVPDFWQKLRLSLDPSIYTIIQSVSESSLSKDWHETHCFSIIYDFDTPQMPQNHDHGRGYRIMSSMASSQTYGPTSQPELVSTFCNSMSNISAGGEPWLAQQDGFNPWISGSQVEVSNAAPYETQFMSVGTGSSWQHISEPRQVPFETSGTGFHDISLRTRGQEMF